LDYFKVIHKKSFTMVHCWRELKECPKWTAGYEAYKKSLKNGGGAASAVIDVEEEGPTKGALPSRPRGHKATKADLKPDASALALSKTLKAMMAEKEEALAKGDEKPRREKEVTCATFIDLTKRAMEIQAIEAEAKLLAEENRIMFADLSLMDPKQRAWFEKKRAIVRQCDA
jgi:hypothetical protein